MSVLQFVYTTKLLLKGVIFWVDLQKYRPLLTYHCRFRYRH